MIWYNYFHNARWWLAGEADARCAMCCIKALRSVVTADWLPASRPLSVCHNRNVAHHSFTTLFSSLMSDDLHVFCINFVLKMGAVYSSETSVPTTVLNCVVLWTNTNWFTLSLCLCLLFILHAPVLPSGEDARYVLNVPKVENLAAGAVVTQCSSAELGVHINR